MTFDTSIKNKTAISNPKLTQLLSFVIAASALVCSGFIGNKNSDFYTLMLLLLCSFCGILIVYRFNDSAHQNENWKQSIKHFFTCRKNQFILPFFIFILLPLALYQLHIYQLTLLAITGIFGIVYAFPFKFKNRVFRFKNLFLVKNLFIGLFWGALILIGSGSPATTIVYPLFVFSFLQVLIGSIIRDVPDLERDQKNGIKSLPVVIGLKQTFAFMHITNAISIGLLLILGQAFSLSILGIVVFLWRTINLLGIFRYNTSYFWHQTFNLFTCVVILITLFVFSIYGIF